MYLVFLGVVFLAMKTLEINPVAEWSWIGVLSPLALAVVWWTWADWSGYTKRKAIQREVTRQRNRLRRGRPIERRARDIA
ncbi:MAG TPA: TIGR04438 family Trp-rich protein [Ramlibacter sp.]|nr:TIGR04438 family Trp-rich protein [Ramlibacter sp.]